MEKSNKRGKIPQQDWPSIIARYEAGETLSSIARTYDCSPPAISYIVSRSRARNAAAEPVMPGIATPSEPLLIKTYLAEPSVAPQAAAGLDPTPVEIAEATAVQATNDPAADSRSSAPRDDPDRQDPGGGSGVTGRQGTDRGDPHRGGGNGNGLAGAPGGDQRRTLHLSALHGNGTPPGPEPDPQPPRPAGADEHARPQFGGEQRFVQPSRQPGNSYPAAGNREPARMSGEPTRPREGGTFIDQELRQRVDSDIAAFLAAFDAALAADTPESRTGLREATDRLLRAGARTRIELERLEARVPLGPRDRTVPAGVPWRQR